MILFIKSNRAEIFASHIPSEDDEWMRLECRLLTQCTRIFPPEKKASDNKTGEEEGEMKEELQEENEEENEGQQEQKMMKKETGTATSTTTANTNTTLTKTNKSATYEEIIFKVSFV